MPKYLNWITLNVKQQIKIIFQVAVLIAAQRKIGKLATTALIAKNIFVWIMPLWCVQIAAVPSLTWFSLYFLVSYIVFYELLDFGLFVFNRNIFLLMFSLSLKNITIFYKDWNEILLVINKNFFSVKLLFILLKTYISNNTWGLNKFIFKQV